MEQMYGTINLLNAELETERRHRAALETAHATARPSTYAAKPTDYLSFEEDVQIPMTEFDEPPTGYVVSQTPVAPSYSPRKLRTMPSPPSHPPQSQHRVARPPVSPRSTTKEQGEELCATLGKNAELRIRSRDMERTVEKTELELELARKQIKMAERRAENREEKLRALLKEKLNWQKELKATRAQVVEEKMRQVDLFREVEAAKRHFTAELEAVEQELRSAQEENTQLRTHAAEMKAQINFQTRKMEEMARQAQDEKARFVAMIEDTRHRFREWKEGEAEARQAAHDQVVRNLKTEYDLKIERHQDEKQKLRDKVNDLEVSMRLLQKDRALSPLELSLRKATILGSKENTGAVAAEHIETQSRILELENLLAHSQEYQARQESIIKLSEATISRLMQEREVTALENLSLHPFGVEPQPRGEDLSYETHVAGYMTAPSSPARPPGTPPRGHQLPVRSNEPPVVRSPKSRAHTPRRADLEASIAQAAELESATNQSVNVEIAAPSSREQSLMEELEQLRKALAEAQVKAEATAVSDNKQVDTSEVDIQASGTLSETVETPVAQDNGKAEESVGTMNEEMTEIKAEDTPEAKDEKHASDTATKVPCESPLPTETDPCQDADDDEEGRSDNAVSDVASADEIPAPSATAGDVEDSRETAVNEPGSCEAVSGETPIEDDVIAATEEGTADPSVKEEVDIGSKDEPIDNIHAQEEEDQQLPCPEASLNESNSDADNVVVVEDVFSDSETGNDAVIVDHENHPAPDEIPSDAEDLKEVDSSLQLGSAAPADESAGSNIGDHDESPKNTDGQDDAIDATAETVSDDNAEQEATTGELAEIDTLDGPFTCEAPQTEVEVVTVDKHEAGDGDPSELEESDADVPAYASDIGGGNATVADAIEDIPDDVNLPRSQVPKEDPSIVIDAGNDGGDANGVAAKQFDLGTITDVPGQGELSGVQPSLADERHADPQGFDSSEVPIPVAVDFDPSIADDVRVLNEFEQSDAETEEVNTSSNAVESDISIPSPAENEPGVIVENSEQEVVEPSKELSAREDEAPSEPVEALVENAIEENGTQVACEEAKPTSSDVVERELTEIVTGSVELPDESNAVEEVAVLDDAQEAAIEPNEYVSIPSDALESDPVEVEAGSVEISAETAITEDDIVESDTNATVDSCEGAPTTSPNEVETAPVECPTESTECPAESDTVETDGVDDSTQIAGEVCAEAPDVSPVVAEHEPVDVSNELMESTAEIGAVEDDIVENDTQLAVEPCDEAPIFPSDVVQSEFVEIPTELVEFTTETVEASTVEVDDVEDTAQSEVKQCVDALLETLSETSALEAAPEDVEECTEEKQVLADSLENVDNADNDAKGMEEDDEEASPAENTAFTDADALVCEGGDSAELSAESSATCEVDDTNEVASAEEVPSETRDEVEAKDTDGLPELPPVSSSIETPKACVAKAVVELVERTALAFVASLHEASHSVLDALADSAEEVSPPAAAVVSEDDGVELDPIDVLPESEVPIIAVDIGNDAVCEALVVSASEGDAPVDVAVLEIAGGECSEVNVAAAEELLAQSDDQPELSISQEIETSTPPENPDAETESAVALTTKDFADNFVRDVLEMFATPASINENQESDEAVTTPDEEAATVDLATLSTESPAQNVAVGTGAFDTAADVTDEVDAEPSLAPTNADDGTSSTQCEVLDLDEVVDLSGSNPVPDDDAQQTELVTLADDESVSAAERFDDTDQDRAPVQDSVAESVSAVDALAVAQEFVADVETRALSTIVSWLQKESGSESARGGEYWDNEELESNSTRSIIDSWNMSEEQNEVNVTTSESEVPMELSSEAEPTNAPVEDADVIEEVARLLVREVAEESELLAASEPHDAVENVTSRTDIAGMEAYEGLTETDSKSERREVNEPGAEVADVAELTAMEFSTQEIVADVAFVFASQAITEALNRLSQPSPLGEEEEQDNQDVNETSNNEQNDALDEDEAGVVNGDEGDDNACNVDEARDIQVGIGSVEDARVGSSEEVTELPENPIEQVVDEINNAHYDEASPPVAPSESPVVLNADVSELIESMVVILAESEGDVSSERRSELVTSPLPVETDLRVEIDGGSVPPDDLVCTNGPLPVVEVEIAVEEVPSVNDAEELPIEGGDNVTELVLAEMIDKVTKDQNSSFVETSDAIRDPPGSPLDSDDMDANSSLEDSCIVDKPGEISDAVDEGVTITTLDPGVESQDDTQTLCVDESLAAIESEIDAPQEILPSSDDAQLMDCDTPEPTELVLDVEENVPSTGIGVLEQSNVEDNGDQVASALESDDMDVIDAILGDIVTAIESYHQVDDPVDDLSVLVEPCSGEPNISIPPSESTELLPAGAIDELAEAVVEAADEALTPEAHADQVVEDVSQSDSIETEADSSQLFVETEDVAVAQAVGDLVDAVADCSNATPTVDSVDEPDFDGEDIKTQCREDEASTEQDTASQDTFESVADSSYDLAVQSGERRVLSDLCTSVERRYAPRHGGRARSVHFAGGTKDESFDRQKHMRRSVLLWEAPVDSASTKESVESAAKRRASKRRVSRRTLADLLAFPTELARFTSSDTTLLAYDARLEQGPIFSLLDQSILTINPDGRHIHLDDQDERLGSSKMIGKRRTLTQELHSKNLARRQIPRFNYMPMSIKFQWSDFVVATPVRPSNISFGEGHNAKSPPIEPMRLLQKKGAKLPCGSYVIVSAFIRPLEDGNENLRVQIYDAERVEEFQFDFSEDITKKYHLESTGMEAQSLEFLGHLEFRRDEDTIIIKLPEKKAAEGSKADPDRLQSERTMVGAGDPRKKELPSKQSRMNAYRQKRPASSPAVTSCQDSSESSAEQISDENADGSEAGDLQDPEASS